ncbi:hypothetical protein FGG08_004291 [Glutinoglossum americanum]|uniref:BZIP domain-containing protein n=1 Tax=Glutinoglossum americanum TaxID=1670608 RepID=A0A9P8KZQ6_9PEZI|nr:hypothetical protein FGG08_004291 [Glutinoglossum americanum]
MIPNKSNYINSGLPEARRHIAKVGFGRLELPRWPHDAFKSAPPRKRKTSVPADVDDDAAEQRKRDKKRVQNRLSQQCYREKQASYIKQLERFVENVQAAGSGQADIPSQLQEMQKKQLRLMKENQELREAILRMRKKLLSLSTAASTSADDVIFERILNAPTDDDQQAKPEEDASQETPAITDVQNPFTINFAAGAIPPLLDAPPVATPDSMTDPLSMDNFNTILNHIPDHIPNHIPNHISNHILNHIPNHISMPSSNSLAIVPPATAALSDHNKQLTGDMPLRFNASLAGPSIPAIAPITTPYYPSRDSIKIDPADYSDIVMEGTEKSVREAMEKMRFGYFRDSYSQWAMARQFTPQQIEEIDHMTLSDLCRIAFRIVFKATALEKYVYAGGTVPVVEKVLRWRISPSAENRAAINEPFRPTPLQQLVRDRHPSIDFIHWGELRDQLIIYIGAYDMQTLIMDSLLYLVREVPQLHIAIPVLEFYNALAAASEPPDFASEPIAAQYDPLIPYNPNSPATLSLVKKFGLDRVLERKLTPVFAKKYPFLDISSSEFPFHFFPFPE